MGIMTIVWLIVLVGLGVIVAPVAAISCAIVARARKLTWDRVAYFAGAGALCGVFITGWIYVLVRLFNRSLPLPLLVVVYFLPYVSWICFGVGGIGISVLWIWEYTLGTDTGYVAPRASVGSAIRMSVFLGSVAAICLFAWAISLRGLIRSYKHDRARQIETPSLEFAYLKPFLYNYIWLAIGLAHAFIVAQYAVSIGIDIQGF